MRIRIREMRERAGLSGRELAKRLGMSQSQISHLETGERHLKPHVQVQIAEELGCEPGDLIDWNAPPPEEVAELIAAYEQMSPAERARWRRAILGEQGETDPAAQS